jgi:hypothetical protein
MDAVDASANANLKTVIEFETSNHHQVRADNLAALETVPVAL